MLGESWAILHTFRQSNMDQSMQRALRPRVKTPTYARRLGQCSTSDGRLDICTDTRSGICRDIRSNICTDARSDIGSDIGWLTSGVENLSEWRIVYFVRASVTLYEETFVKLF